MKAMFKLAAALALAGVATAPAAAWKLAERGQAVTIGKSTMTITPGEDWNREKNGLVKGSEIWTLDGVSLNELFVLGALPAGRPIAYEYDKKNNPLPKFAETMQLTDLPDLLEGTWRVSRNAVVFKIDKVEPAKLGTRDAIRFSYSYVAEGNKLPYQGLATGAIVNKQLYLIVFEAPPTHYFPRDRAKAEAIMASATI